MSVEQKNSFHGKMMEVDLTAVTAKAKPLSRELIELYLGQKGLGARILMEDVPPDTDPLSPQNELVLSTAVMAGTIVSCSAKLAITAKSPLTGTISDGSVGGHAGAELKYAGYDALSIRGKAASLSYIYIDPDRTEIRDASFLRGLGTFRTDEVLKEKLQDEDLKILAIGPAGENMVPFACISSERYRQLGRGGLGAVFGSKNLKAIVIKGWLPVYVPDMKTCMESAAEAHIKDNVINPSYEIYTDGTPILVDMTNESGLLPTRNFSEGQFELYEDINTTAFKAVRRAKKACFSCGIACGNYVVDGSARVEGPEFETIALLGSSIGNGDRRRLIELNSLCDDLGLDTISTGGIIAWMMEMTEKGLKDFGIRFGQGDKAADLIRDIALRKGLGAEAALGTKALSAKYGGADFAMHIKGMELPGYDPRGSWGMGIAYASAPRGGCHMSAYPIVEEAWGNRDPFTFEGKAQLVADMQNAQFAKFSMGVCDFWPINSTTLGRMYEITFGGNWPSEEVDRAGERIFNLQRMYNIMAGSKGKDDTLPRRLFREPLPSGPPKDHPMTEENFKVCMKEYYEIRGWDPEGKPTIEKLKELDIEPELIELYRKAAGL